MEKEQDQRYQKKWRGALLSLYFLPLILLACVFAAYLFFPEKAIILRITNWINGILFLAGVLFLASSIYIKLRQVFFSYAGNKKTDSAKRFFLAGIWYILIAMLLFASQSFTAGPCTGGGLC